jgi:hypothetical protein
MSYQALSYSHLLIFWNTGEKVNWKFSIIAHLGYFYLCWIARREDRSVQTRTDVHYRKRNLGVFELAGRGRKNLSLPSTRCVINTPNEHFSVHIRPMR